MLAAVLAGGMALGLGAARLAFEEGSGDRRAVEGGAPGARDVSALPESAASAVPPGGAPATDPIAAVSAFLTAEVASDFESSWSLLASEDRARYGSPAGWVAAHEAIATVTGFTVGADIGGGEVRVQLTMRAGLDGVLGLVPARAESTWAVVPEDGGWRVAFGRSVRVPVLPDDAAAADAAAAWARDRQRCDDEPAGQHGTLVGTVGLADRLCDAAGTPQANAPERLPASDTTRFVSAFGPDVVDWARTVALDGVVPMRAVLAPIGDRWIVVGVLPPIP